MSDRLVVLASFTTPVEADLVIAVLQAEGIRARISDEATTGWLWHLSGAVGGAKVLIREEDEPRAREVLLRLEEERRAELSEGSLPTAPWVCAKCGERLSEEFEVCWKCGTAFDASTTIDDANDPAAPRPDTPTDTRRPEPLQGGTWTCSTCAATVHADDRTCPECGTSTEGRVNPYFTRAGAPADSPKPVPRIGPDAEVLVTRAWRAAVIGVVLLPPLLSLYSMWLLVNVGLRPEGLSPAGTRKFYGALVVNIVVGATIGRVGLWMLDIGPAPY
jgi:hypothetical protein